MNSHDRVYLGDPESMARKLYPEKRVSLWIKNWQPSYQMWPLQYPLTPLMVTGALSSNYITGRLLKLFKIRGKHTIFSARLPSMITLGALVAFRGTGELPSVAYSFKECLICFQMKAAALQVFAAVLHPWFLSLLCCSHIAIVQPGAFYSDWRGNLRLVWNDVKSKPTAFLTLALMNAVVAVAFTELQQSTMLKVFDAIRRERLDPTRRYVPREV